MKEIWKDIWIVKWVDYTWLYQISNLGRVIVLKNNNILKWWSSWWYRNVHLSKNWISKKYFIHRLVGLTFIPNPKNKPQINHINWIKSDNRVENLEWCTSKENIIHSWNMGLSKDNLNFIKYHSSKWKFWRNNFKSKKVNQYTLNWDFVKTWLAIIEVQVELKIDVSWIIRVCKWKQKTAWGFIWKYAE
jgi:hypothetical protein